MDRLLKPNTLVEPLRAGRVEWPMISLICSGGKLFNMPNTALKSLGMTDYYSLRIGRWQHDGQRTVPANSGRSFFLPNFL